MKKFLSLLMLILVVGGSCLGANQVKAAGYFNATAKSNVHSYGGSSQYFNIEAEFRYVGSSTNLSSWSSKWTTNGSGAFYREPISYYRKGNSFIFNGISTIDRSSVLLTATINV